MGGRPDSVGSIDSQAPLPNQDEINKASAETLRTMISKFQQDALAKDAQIGDLEEEKQSIKDDFKT